jgi:Ca-activated chloride channel family protein
VSGSRGIVIAIAAAAVVIALVLNAGGGDDGDGDGGETEKSGDAIAVSLAYSPEKEELLEPLIERFNGERKEAGGRPVFVEGEVVSSGEAQSKIAQGKLRPVAWSPASSLWGRLLEHEADADLVPDDNPSIVRTPLVIAMWEPLAQALGYPEKKVGFDEILELATDPRGWARYGEPQFGEFKLGHTNPDFSTSGLSAVAAEYYAATGKLEGLTERDVSRPRVRNRIRGIERSIVHYGDTTLFFAEQLKRYGPAYASAVAMEEVTLVDFNEGRGDATKLIGIYPEEGTFFSDNPYIVLDAPWVSAEEKEAAQVFGEWLTGEVDADLAAQSGFRPGDSDERPKPPVDRANGADPAEPRRVLTLPEPRVLARIKEAWREDRKPANVMLVVDVSGSMGEESKLDEAKQGLEVFLRQISPRDRIGLIQFDEEVTPLLPIRPFGETRAELAQTVEELFPDGQTAVYDATARGYEEVRALGDETRINAVVVLTDGADNESSTSVDALVRSLEAQASNTEQTPIRVYTIAYGSEAQKSVLERIATSSGGKAFEGDPDDIEAVYRSISSFF